MKCQFANLKFGEVVSLTGGTACCGTCGNDVQKAVQSIKWVYNGHSAEYDLFSPTQVVRCDVCGEPIIGYGQVCGEAGGLDITAFIVEPVKVERNKNGNNT